MRPVDKAIVATREVVFERLESGALPRGPAHKVFGGRGTGSRCNGCDLPITAEQVEFEIHAGSVSTPHLFRMHSHCLHHWYDGWAGP